MKKIIILLMIVAIFVAFNEQNKVKPNVIITVVSVVIFMLGMMKLSAKIPPKNNDDYEEKI